MPVTAVAFTSRVSCTYRLRALYREERLRSCMRKSKTRLSKSSAPRCTDGIYRRRALYCEFAVEVLHAKVKDPVIKILAAKMHVTSSGLHLEDVHTLISLVEGAKPVSSFVIRARCQRSSWCLRSTTLAWISLRISTSHF